MSEQDAKNVLFFIAFQCLVATVILSFAPNPALLRGPKPTGHYAVDESQSYLVWYALEEFPSALQSTLKPK